MTPHEALVAALTVERQTPMPRWTLTNTTAIHRDSDAVCAARRWELDAATRTPTRHLRSVA